MEPTQFYVGDEFSIYGVNHIVIKIIDNCIPPRMHDKDSGCYQCSGQELYFADKNGDEGAICSKSCTLVKRAKGAETLKINPKEEVMQIPEHLISLYHNTKDLTIVARWFPDNLNARQALLFEIHKKEYLHKAERLEAEEKAQEGK